MQDCSVYLQSINISLRGIISLPRPWYCKGNWVNSMNNPKSVHCYVFWMNKYSIKSCFESSHLCYETMFVTIHRKSSHRVCSLYNKEVWIFANMSYLYICCVEDTEGQNYWVWALPLYWNTYSWWSEMLNRLSILFNVNFQFQHHSSIL